MLRIFLIFLICVVFFIFTTEALGLSLPSTKLEADTKRGTGQVAFSPNGRFIATGAYLDEGGFKFVYAVAVWDVKTGKNVALLRGHTDTVIAVVFSPDSNILISGATDQTAMLWDVKNWKHLATLKQTGNRYVNPLAISPDGLFLAAGNFGDDAPGRIHVWNINTRKLIGTIQDYSGGSILFLPDRNVLMFPSGRNIKLLDLDIMQIVGVIEQRSSGFTLSPDGKILAFRDIGINLLDMEKNNISITLKGDYKWTIGNITFFHDGKYIAAIADDIKVFIWDVQKEDPIAMLPHNMRDIVFSPNGKYLAGVEWGGTGIILWDTSELIAGGEPGQEPGYAVTPGGKLTTTWGAVKGS